MCVRIIGAMWRPSIKKIKTKEILSTILICFRTAEDIQVLERHEIHPMRTAFVAALGEGAFGKVHLATYEEGLEYFKDNQEKSRKIRQQFVAVKELHGKPFSMLLLLVFYAPFSCCCNALSFYLILFHFI